MASQKTIGARVELSGTRELTDSIKSIQNSMKTLQSESKLLSNRYKDDADSVDYLRDKQQLLNQMLDKQQEAVRQYSQALSTSQGNLSRCGDNVETWRQKLSDAQAELERLQSSTTASTDDIERQQQEVEKANRGLETAQRQYNTVENSVNRYQRELNNAQSELINLNRELDDNARSLQEVENSTNECTDSINDFGEAVGQAGEESSTFGDVLRANLASEAITGAVTTIVDKVKEIGSAVVDASMEFEQSSNKMAAATGATAEEMQGLEQVMMNIYNDNFGDSFEDIGETVTNLKTQFRDLDNTQLQNLAEQAYLLRDTFGAETPELIRAAKTLMDQFGISGEEAFNLIAQGYQNNLDFSGEFLDTINEYSVQYSNAGLSADDFFNSLANGAKNGAFNLDKVGRQNCSL